MRPRLLDPERDVDLDGPARYSRRGLVQDLELEALVDAMAGGDPTIAAVARRLLLDPLTDEEAIRYRQGVLRTCLDHPTVVRGLYAISVQTLERRKKVYWGLVRRPDAVVHHGIELVNLYLGAFRRLRSVADGAADTVGPTGLGALLATVRRDLDDAFLAEVGGHLRALRFQAGIAVSARLGAGNTGADYVLDRPAPRRPPAREVLAGWVRRLRRSDPPEYTYRLPSDEDRGLRALGELQARGLERTAAAIAAACDDLLWLFRQLRGELAFYVGSLNLHERLAALGAPTCVPDPQPRGSGERGARDLYDPSLALTVGRAVVGNDVETDGADLVVVTGANQGGKTTFLRSVGAAHLMMQCGMFVAARSYRSSVATGLFTHFTREEDVAMRRGKLDEELSRLNEIVGSLTPGAVLLLNESFASTNEREGSELAAGIVEALTESGVTILFVTHLTRFATSLHEGARPGTCFLRAERRPDGTRTFKMIEGAPTRTSHGTDLYRAVFGGSPGARAAPPASPPEAAHGD